MENRNTDVLFWPIRVGSPWGKGRTHDKEIKSTEWSIFRFFHRNPKNEAVDLGYTQVNRQRRTRPVVGASNGGNGSAIVVIRK